MQVSLLKTIVLVLLFLSVVLILRIVIKREMENVLRAVIIFLLLGGVFYYLETTEAETLTLADISAQIKEKFFPEKVPDYVYLKEEGHAGRNNYVRYFF